jgi:outer membrane lipoprotein carrier protein
MRLSILAAAALLAATNAAATNVAGAQVGAQSVDGTIDRAVAAWSKVRTVRGTFEQTVTNSLTGSSAMSRGDYIQERPNRLSIRFTPPAAGEIVADGQVVWVYLPSSTPGQVIKRRATDRSAVPIDLTGQFLDAPRTKYDIADAGTKTVNRHATHGLILTPKQGSDAPFTKATVWVDDDDSLIREFEMVEGNGVTRHIHLLTVQIDAPIEQSAFAFTIPKGVKVVDQTKP